MHCIIVKRRMNCYVSLYIYLYIFTEHASLLDPNDHDQKFVLFHPLWCSRYSRIVRAKTQPEDAIAGISSSTYIKVGEEDSYSGMDEPSY